MDLLLTYTHLHMSYFATWQDSMHYSHADDYRLHSADRVPATFSCWFWYASVALSTLLTGRST